jgi:hypothetical protein
MSDAIDPPFPNRVDWQRPGENRQTVPRQSRGPPGGRQTREVTDYTGFLEDRPRKPLQRRLWIRLWAERKRCALRADLKRFICRSRRRVDWCDTSARLLRYRLWWGAVRLVVAGITPHRVGSGCFGPAQIRDSGCGRDRGTARSLSGTDGLHDSLRWRGLDSNF